MNKPNFQQETKNMNTQFKNALLAAGIATALSACGGGGGSVALPGDNDLNTGATQTPVTVSGKISGFGSVIINGVHYKTTSSRLVSDDDGSLIKENPTDDEVKAFLGLGEIIQVKANRDSNGNNVATTITVDDEIVGKLQSIDDSTLTFKVLGQTISVTSDTIIDDSLLNDSTVDAPLGSRNLSDLSWVAGTTFVEISGFPGPNGIEATRIEDASVVGNATAARGEVELKGSVTSLDNINKTFTINNLNVNYASLSVTLIEGDFVEVKGTFDDVDTLTATRIQHEDNGFDEGEIEVEGAIQKITPTTGTAGTVTINGFTFTVADISQYSEGMKIEIKAQIQNGAPLVTRIQDETEDSIRIQDKVTGTADTDSTAGDDVVTTRLGLNVTPGNRSRLELNDSIPSIADFLAGVQAGDYIEARGFPLNGKIVWTRIEVESDSKEECRLRGPVGDNPTNPSFSIEGVLVTTNSSTVFRNADDTLIADAETFFGMLSAGDVVQAKSASNGAACNNLALNPAKEVSFEPGDDILENNASADDNGGANEPGDDNGGTNEPGDDNGGANEPGDDNGGNVVGIDNELKGSVSNIVGNTFDIDGETVTVDDVTMIDNSIIEDARGNTVELDNDLAFGDSLVTESLVDLLNTDGTIYVVSVDRSSGSPVATLIEDF
jgi:hypothetical protein